MPCVLFVSPEPSPPTYKQTKSLIRDIVYVFFHVIKIIHDFIFLKQFSTVNCGLSQVAFFKVFPHITGECVQMKKS